jgi:hypothetical protein
LPCQSLGPFNEQAQLAGIGKNNFSDDIAGVDILYTFLRSCSNYCNCRGNIMASLLRMNRLYFFDFLEFTPPGGDYG